MRRPAIVLVAILVSVAASAAPPSAPRPPSSRACSDATFRSTVSTTNTTLSSATEAQVNRTNVSEINDSRDEWTLTPGKAEVCFDRDGETATPIEVCFRDSFNFNYAAANVELRFRILQGASGGSGATAIATTWKQHIGPTTTLREETEVCASTIAADGDCFGLHAFTTGSGTLTSNQMEIDVDEGGTCPLG